MKSRNLDEALFDLYKQYRNVVNSIGIGNKNIRGHYVDTESIVFSVDQKKNTKDLELKDIIPPIVVINEKSYPTDVVVGNTFATLLGTAGCSGVGLTGTWTEKHRSLLPINDDLRCGVYIGCNPANATVTVTDGRNDYSYEGQKGPIQGTLGAILIDQVDDTIYGLTAGHNVLFSNYNAGDYKILQEDLQASIEADNIFADNSGCPVTSVYQPDIPEFGGSQNLGPIKRYFPLRSTPIDLPGHDNVFSNYIDAAVFAFPKGTKIPKDSWKQLNFVLNEDLKDIEIKVSVSGVSENISTDKKLFLADIIVKDNDNYRKYNAWLVGEDSKYFQIDMPTANNVGSKTGNPQLYLKKDILLDYEKKSTYNIDICVKDYNSVTREPTEIAVDEITGLPITLKEVVSSGFKLDIFDDNDVFDISISGIVNSIPENYITYSGIHLANILLNDEDEKGSNVFTLSGKDAELFMLLPENADHPTSPLGLGPSDGQQIEPSGISKIELWYKPSLEGFNYEVQNKYSVIIEMIDYEMLQTRGPIGLYYSFVITDVNEYIYNFFIVDIVDTIKEQDYYVDNTIAPLAYNLKVAEVYWVEPDFDIMGSHKIELFGPDVNYFFLDLPDTPQNIHYGQAPIYLKAGTILDYETKSEYNIGVKIYDELLPDEPPLVQYYKLIVTNTNDPSYGMFLNRFVENIDENTTLSNDLLLANIGFYDQDEWNNNYLLVGEQSEFFKIDGSGLYLIAGTNLDYEYINEYNLTIYGYNANLKGNKPLSVGYRLTINDLNDGEQTKPGPAAEPVLEINTIITDLDENASTTQKIAVANLETSFALNNPPYEYAIYGPDAPSFSIENDVLYLNENVILNHEIQKRLSVIVVIEKFGWNVASDTYDLEINKVNYAASSIQILNPRLYIKENTDTTYARIPLGIISYIDDGYGSNVLSLSGNDAVFFEIEHNILYLKTNVVLNYENKPFYSISVDVTDSSAVNNPKTLSTNYILSVVDVNENPSNIFFLLDPINTIPEDIDINDPIYLGSLAWGDPDNDVLYLDSNNVKLYGLDSIYFSIVFTNGVYELYLNSGTILDHDIKPIYNIDICVIDDTLSGNIPVCLSYQLNITAAPKIGYLILNEDNYLPITKIEHATYTDDPLELAEIISYQHNGIPKCGTYSIADGLYADNFYLETDDNDCSMVKLFLKKDRFMDFWADQSQCIVIECSQPSGETVSIDYCLDIIQPYLPMATEQEIDNLQIGTTCFMKQSKSSWLP